MKRPRTLTTLQQPKHWARLIQTSTDGIPDVAGLRRSAIVHNDGSPYLERFHLIDTEQVQVRYHHWLAGDPDRDQHDHPWDNATHVLAGHLIEHTPDGSTPLAPGTFVARQADDPHRIELVSTDAWTLFITGPIIRSWGFHTDHGWQGWRDYPQAGRYE